MAEQAAAQAVAVAPAPAPTAIVVRMFFPNGEIATRNVDTNTITEMAPLINAILGIFGANRAQLMEARRATAENLLNNLIEMEAFFLGPAPVMSVLPGQLQPCYTPT